MDQALASTYGALQTVFMSQMASITISIYVPVQVPIAKCSNTYRTLWETTTFVKLVLQQAGR
jgi:hypothetical protein